MKYYFFDSDFIKVIRNIMIQILSPERAQHNSPGQRPGLNITTAKALKGRNIKNISR